MVRRWSFSRLFSLFLQTLGLSLAYALVQTDEDNNNDNNKTNFLQDVLMEISTQQKWNLEEVKFSKLQPENIRVGTGQSFEHRTQFEKNSHFVFLLPDEEASWRKISRPGVDLEDLVNEANFTVVLDSFKIEGPFEIWVAGDDQISLTLLNISYAGLKRVRVAEGISVEVKGAQEVSLFRTPHLTIPANDNRKSLFWSSSHSLCIPLLPVRVLGSASLKGYRTRNPGSIIRTTSSTKQTIELLAEKCYSKNHIPNQPRITDYLGLRIARVERILSSLNNGTRQKESSGSLDAILKASALLQFELEIERKIETSARSLNGTLAEWRTRPRVERVWFEVMARVEAGKLRPLMVKMVRPFVSVESATWSNLMANISFTKFQSILVPQEALTLDIK